MLKASLRIPLPDDVTALDMAVALDAFRAGREAMLGVINQPRCRDAMHRIIESEVERLDEIEDAILDRLTAQPIFDDFNSETLFATVMVAMADRGFCAADMLARFAAMLGNIMPPTSADAACREDVCSAA